ncbi:hypothetical protein N7451_009068 [Penicillium sp. IBT 35674x]|nr:hypothetical protein N7451_009068 [Penicillium sp. IBT 35674x]
MSAIVVLAQFDALVNKMESVSLKLCQKRIRPSANQLNEFQGLYMRFKGTLANFDAGIQRLLAIGYPDENDIQLAAQVRSAKSASLSLSTMTTLKRNLVLIFMGPTTFSLDSQQVKARNKQTEMRCEALKSQHAHVVLMWAMTLRPSSWKTSGGMNDKSFAFLIDELRHERMNQNPPQLYESMLSLAAEGPMKDSEPFKTFVHEAFKPVTEQSSTLKRKRTEEAPINLTAASEMSGSKKALAAKSSETPHSFRNNPTTMQQNRRKTS